MSWYLVAFKLKGSNTVMHPVVLASNAARVLVGYLHVPQCTVRTCVLSRCVYVARSHPRWGEVG